MRTGSTVINTDLRLHTIGGRPLGVSEGLIQRRRVIVKERDRVVIEERQNRRQELMGHAFRWTDPEEGVGDSRPRQASDLAVLVQR